VGGEAQREAQLISYVESLRSAQAAELSALARDEAALTNERFLAVFALAQRPAEFRDHLLAIATAPSDLLAKPAPPHSIAETRRHAAVAVRLQALLGLDALARKDPAFLDSMRAMAARHAHPLLRKAARVVIAGAESGRPLLQDYVDTKLRGVLYATGK
jgi:hypothetical protein